MEILSVTLKNFKSHSDRHFQFQPGTNAICGENGAGKTSILEAIAWTLFNYRGAYKNEDFIRNGAGSAQASVSFISNRDGRTYDVQRCTSRGYTIFDPQLGQRLDYKHIEDEILPWLRQQMGVAPGTDLGRLFANTIGVPQGTFTADFLQPPERRKQVFDTILKVEEYKQASQQMLSLERYAKAAVETLEQAIARHEEDLLALAPTQVRHDQLAAEIRQNEATLLTLQAELAQLQAQKDQLAAQAQLVLRLETQLKTLDAQIEGTRQSNVRLTQSVEQAKQAAATCAEQRPNYEGYLQAEATLQQLEQQGKQRRSLLKQRDALQQAIALRQTEDAKLSLQLDQLTRSSQEIDALQPLIAKQVDLEQQQATTAEQLNQVQVAKAEHKTLIRQQTKLAAEQQQLTQELERLRALETEVEQIPQLEQQRDRLQEQLSRIDAAQQFETELRHLISTGEAERDRHAQGTAAALATLQEMQQAVPLLATLSVESVVAALQAGVALNSELLTALQQILADLAEQTSATKLRQQLAACKQAIDSANRLRAEFLTLASKTAQTERCQQELAQLQTRLGELSTQLAAEPTLLQQRSHLIEALKPLGDPRGRSQILARDLMQLPQLQARYAELQAAQQEMQQAIADLDAQMQPFASLDSQLEHYQQFRQSYQPGYQTFLQSQQAADQLPALEAELSAAIAQIQQLETQRTALASDYDQHRQTYDPLQLQQVEATYTATRSQADRIEGSLPQQRALLNELHSQLVALQAIAEQRDRDQKDLKRKEKIRKFISFARKVYKEAAPRITERYVQRISQEADRLFRELLNRPNVSLRWSNDYEIIVQEGAHLRRLLNLSGGEQMCAALAVRLALLRVLADIDVAFFDEPTTNMDRPRRASLAEAIANIKTFRQLFVISHDDTFEQVTENIILVQRSTD